MASRSWLTHQIVLCLIKITKLYELRGSCRLPLSPLLPFAGLFLAISTTGFSNAVRCQDTDSVDFLIARPGICSCSGAAEVQPESGRAAAHDALARLLLVEVPTGTYHPHWASDEALGRCRMEYGVDVISDVICPWCYIGKRRLERAVRDLGGRHEVRVRWHPFQLNPTMPEGGMDRKDYRTAKFGSWERSQALDAQVAAAGIAEGIAFAFDRIGRTPNTLDAHRLIALAGERGVQDAVVEAFFRGYFAEARDLGDRGDAPRSGRGGRPRPGAGRVPAWRRRGPGVAPRRGGAVTTTRGPGSAVLRHQRRGHHLRRPGASGVPRRLRSGLCRRPGRRRRRLHHRAGRGAGVLNPAPRVVVVGGSSGGRFRAIALRSLGCEVEVFQKSAGLMHDRGGTGMGGPPPRRWRGPGPWW